MRMPFIEFITNGDLKFLIVYIIFTILAFYAFFKKLKTKNNAKDKTLEAYYNAKINSASFWILISGALSLLLGLLHSFYFIGKAGGIAPNMIFQGVSYALITPVLGVCLFIICKVLSSTFNLKTVNTK